MNQFHFDRLHFHFDVVLKHSLSPFVLWLDYCDRPATSYVLPQLSFARCATYAHLSDVRECDGARCDFPTTFEVGGDLDRDDH